MTGRNVLSLEDESDTVSAVIAELRAADIEVDEVSDIEVAEEAVRRRKFDLILVDLRMPRGSEFLQTGGVRFVRQLKDQVFGTRNEATPFALLTAYAHDDSVDEVESLRGFIAVIPKTDDVVSSLISKGGDTIPWLRDIVLPVQPSFIVDDLVAFEGFEDNAGNLRVTVGAWPNGDSVLVRKSELPWELRQELDYGVRPIFAWAKVNISAEEESEVRPHDFRLEPREDVVEGQFDWGRSSNAN